MPCDNCSTPKGSRTNYHDYYSENIYTWCTNCGNYGIAAALKRALVAEDLPPHEVVLAFDIGCNGNGADKILGYRIHGLHGRVLPLAAGAALANNKLKVIASAGDGATLSEGINHLVHSVRNNYNMVFILHNNGNYGLTTGQASQTTKQGQPMNSSPDGVDTVPMNVCDFVMGLNPSFVARTFSGDVHQMTEIFRAGIQHKGFAFIEVLQNCPTYNKSTPHEWYMERVYDTITIPNYDNTNLIWAKEVAQDLENKIASGIIYKNPNLKDFYTNQNNREGINSELVEEVKNIDLIRLLNEFN